MSETPRKAIIMRSEIASTELGKAFTQSFEVRFGPSLQADVILPGPPISWAFLFLEDLTSQRLLSSVTRLDRMVTMFEHAIVVLLRPAPEGLIRFQRHLAESGYCSHIMLGSLIYYLYTPCLIECSYSLFGYPGRSILGQKSSSFLMLLQRKPLF